MLATLFHGMEQTTWVTKSNLWIYNLLYTTAINFGLTIHPTISFIVMKMFASMGTWIGDMWNTGHKNVCLASWFLTNPYPLLFHKLGLVLSCFPRILHNFSFLSQLYTLKGHSDFHWNFIISHNYNFCHLNYMNPLQYFT